MRMLLLALLLTSCATTANQMMAAEPARTYSSVRQHQDVARCIATSVPGASVIPGAAETIVNVQNPDGSILLTWRIRSVAGGSEIHVWRANSIAPGLSRAERCF